MVFHQISEFSLNGFAVLCHLLNLYENSAVILKRFASNITTTTTIDRRYVAVIYANVLLIRQNDCRSPSIAQRQK